MTRDEARRLLATARVARLATTGDGGRPHLVPIVFAVRGDTIFHAVDAKPKRTRALQRLANVAAYPAVSVLADHYEEDWDRLWWVRADGAARILDDGDPEAAQALERLAERYDQYRAATPGGPVVAIDVQRWTGWRAAGG